MKLSCHEFGNWIIQEMLKCGPVQSWCVALQFVFFPKYDVRCDLHRIEKGNYGCAQFADTADLVDAQLQDWAIALQDGRELSLRCRNKLEMTHLQDRLYLSFSLLHSHSPWAETADASAGSRSCTRIITD